MVAVGDAVRGHVFGEIAAAAARFLVLHGDAIVATAPAQDQTGSCVAESMPVRADGIVREPHEKRWARARPAWTAAAGAATQRG